MSRLFHAGAETGALQTEGLTLVGTTLTFDTGAPRTGTRCWMFTSSAANTLTYSFTGATARRYWSCLYIRFPAASGLPGANARILQWQTAAAGVLVSAQLTTGGKLQLLNQAGTQIGNDSSTTLVADTWYRVELGLQIDTGSVDFAALRLNGDFVANTAVGAFSDTAPGKLVFGWIDDPGTSEVLCCDDLSINDSQGSVNNNWVGPSAVYLLLPTSDNADGGWTAGGGGTSLFAGVDNVPPVGAASPGLDAGQIGNAVSSTTDNADLNLASYTTAGVAAGDTVAAVYGIVEAGNSSTSGSDTLRISVQSNPAIGETNPSIDVTVGTYPTGWNHLTTVISENPTVTRGTSPVMRVGKNIANTRRANVCFLGLYVGAVTPYGSPTAYPGTWTPADLGTAPRFWGKEDGLAGLVDGQTVGTWTDSSGSGNDATQATEATKPVHRLGGLNNYPSVEFVSADILGSNLESASSDATFLMVYDDNGSSTDQMITSASTSGAGSWHLGLMGSLKLRGTESGVVDWSNSTDSWPTTPSILGMSVNGTTSHEYHINGTTEVQSHGATSFAPPRPSVFGANFAGSAPIRGRVYEIIATDYLSQADRESVEGYLAHKYGITSVLPGGHPYKSTPPSGSTPQSASDSRALSIADTAAGAAAYTNADTRALSIADSAAFTYPLSADADSRVLTIVDTASVAIPVAAADTQTLTIVDSAASDAAYTDADTRSLTSVDTASLAASYTDADSRSLTIVDTAVFSSPVQADDTRSLSIVDSVSLAVAVSAAADTRTLTATDAVTLAFTTPDTRTLTATDAVSVAVSATDAQTLTATDAAALSLTATDTRVLTAAETLAIGLAIADTRTLTAAEAAGIGLIVADVRLLVLSDTATLPAVAGGYRQRMIVRIG